jgi:hypothetical protein
LTKALFIEKNGNEYPVSPAFIEFKILKTITLPLFKTKISWFQQMIYKYNELLFLYCNLKIKNTLSTQLFLFHQRYLLIIYDLSTAPNN